MQILRDFYRIQHCWVVILIILQIHDITHSSQHKRQIQHFFARCPVPRFHCQHHLYNIIQIYTIVTGQLGISTFDNFLIKPIHILSPKWWLLTSHLINHTSSWPYIRSWHSLFPKILLLIIWLIHPYFWRCVIRSSSLCIKQSFFRDFRHIHISDFHKPVFVHEYICTFHVAMENFHIMLGFQTFQDL